MECHQDITPETPSLALLALHMLACAYSGNAGLLCCQTGIRQKRESAPLACAVKGRPQGNPTPGRWRALSLSAIELYSVKMGKRRQIQILSTH